MSQRQRTWIGVGIALIAAALVVWWWRGRDTHSAAATDSASSSERSAQASDLGSIGREIKKQPDPKKSARGSIAGTVRDEDKRPIANARVCVDAWSSELSADDTREPNCKQTDAQGGYKIDNLFAAHYFARAGAPTYRPDTFHPTGDRHKSRFDLAPGEAKSGVDFVLKKGGVEVRGTVSDISGGPISHAHVAVNSGMWGNGEYAPTVDTDDKGAYSTWTIPGDVRVSVSAEAYADASRVGKAPGKVDILMTPEGGLSGTVVDANTNQPVPDVDVMVEASEWSWEGRESDRTDAAGKFKVHHLPPGRFVVTARNDHGYGRTDGSVMVGLGQMVDGVVVKLYPASRIVGKVMIAGSPPSLCVDANVWFRDEVHDRWVNGETETDGTVHADGVLPGTYAPQVQCEGYRAEEKYPPVVVAGKDVVDQTWTVALGSSIKGHVTTKSGQPVQDAQVNARTVGGDARAKMGWANDRTLADGSFELRELKAATYEVNVDTDKGTQPRDGYKIETPAAGVVQKEIVLDDGGSIKGIVVDGQGKPVEDVQINANALDEQNFWRQNPIKSGEDGTFSVDGLRPGAYRVTATHGWFDELRKPGTNDDAQQGEKVTVAIGKASDVKLVVEAQAGTIKGSVVDADGQPVTDAFLSTARESDAAGAAESHASQTRDFDWGDGPKPVLTGPDGTFTVTKLSPGKYTLRAYRKGGGEALLEHVAVGATNAKLQIKRTASIEGVAKREGAMPDELKVSIVDLKGGFNRSESFYRTGGKFKIGDLPAGHFSITVSVEGGQKKVDVDLAEGEQKTGIEVTLEELIDFTGRVVDRVTKQPVSGIMVFAQPASSGGGISFTWGEEDNDHISDASGKFTVKRAPKGQLAIQGMSKDWKTSDYGFFRVVKTVNASGDIGDIGVLKKRIKDGQTAGKLGLHWKDLPNDTLPDQQRLEVSYVEPDGPCAKLDIKPGDIIVTVDGVDVLGAGTADAWQLMNAPVGTKLTLGLKRGNEISVILAPP